MYRIETRNYYLRIALENIILKTRNESDLCIIDLSSFYSLREIIQCVNENNIVERFILISDEGVNSRLLASQTSLRSKMAVGKYHEVIQHCPGVTREMLMHSLNQNKNMEAFSHKEVTTIYSLLLHDSMINAAGFIGIKPKVFYQRVDKLVKKLNMANRLQAQHFLRREFCKDTIRKKIASMLVQSFRM